MRQPWDQIQGRIALVTGAGGFVGANLCRALVRAGAHVHAIVRSSTNRWRLQAILSQLTVHDVDLLDAAAVGELLRQLAPEYVFHTALGRAARHAETSPEIIRANVVAVTHLFDAMERTPPRAVVHSGSQFEYGPAAGPLAEAHCAPPHTSFGRGKAAQTAQACELAQRYGLPLVVLRLFSVYGPFEDPRRLIPTALRAAHSGEPLRLTPPGIRRDFVFIDDVVNAYLCAATTASAHGQIFNVGTGHETTNEEVVARIQSITGSSFQVRPGAYPLHTGDQSHWVADIDKARSGLGFVAHTALGDGLAQTAAWMNDNPSYARRCEP